MSLRLRTFFTCLSIANLLFASAWIDLHFGQLSWRLKAPIIGLHAALLLDTLILGVGFFAADALLSRFRWRPIARRIGLLIFLLLFAKAILDISAIDWLKAVFTLSASTRVFAGLASFGVGVFLVRWLLVNPKPLRMVGLLILAMAPLYGINLWLATRVLMRGSARYADLPPMQSPPAAKPGPRVIWIIFDTLDYHYLFEEHPNWLKTPDFDRLRSQSVDFTYALAPGSRTEISIPAFLLGKVYTDQVLISPSDFRMTLLGGQTEHFHGKRTVFLDAEEMGARTAMLGFHLPYGRLIGDQVSYCRWWQWPTTFGADQPWINTAAEMFAAVPNKPVTTQLMVERQIRNHEDELAAAEQLLADKSYRLEFFHFFPPHEPSMYDGVKHQYAVHGVRTAAEATKQVRPDGYFHGLALANDSFARLRKEMERDGTWNDSLVIITADHSWRLAGFDGFKVYPRVPFLCHLPGETNQVKAPDRMNTLLVHDLLLDYLKGLIPGPKDLVGWVRRWTASHPDVPLTDDPPNAASNNRPD